MDNTDPSSIMVSMKPCSVILDSSEVVDFYCWVTGGYRYTEKARCPSSEPAGADSKLEPPSAEEEPLDENSGESEDEEELEEIFAQRKEPRICPLCSSKCATMHVLRVHLTDAHNAAQCQQCGKSLPNLSDLCQHLTRVHMVEDGHFCSECGQFFSLDILLQIHLVNMHGYEAKKIDRSRSLEDIVPKRVEKKVTRSSMNLATQMNLESSPETCQPKEASIISEAPAATTQEAVVVPLPELAPDIVHEVASSRPNFKTEEVEKADGRSETKPNDIEKPNSLPQFATKVDQKANHGPEIKSNVHKNAGKLEIQKALELAKKWVEKNYTSAIVPAAGDVVVTQNKVANQRTAIETKMKTAVKLKGVQVVKSVLAKQKHCVNKKPDVVENKPAVSQSCLKSVVNNKQVILRKSTVNKESVVQRPAASVVYNKKIAGQKSNTVDTQQVGAKNSTTNKHTAGQGLDNKQAASQRSTESRAAERSPSKALVKHLTVEENMQPLGQIKTVVPQEVNLAGSVPLSTLEEVVQRTHEVTSRNKYSCTIGHAVYKVQGNACYHLSCKHCDTTMENHVSLGKHLMVKHCRLICRACGEDFSDQAALKIHEMSRHGIRGFHCMPCRLNFENIRDMHNHYVWWHDCYHCKSCKKDLLGQFDLKVHLILYHANLSDADKLSIVEPKTVSSLNQSPSKAQPNNVMSLERNNSNAPSLNNTTHSPDTKCAKTGINAHPNTKTTLRLDNTQTKNKVTPSDDSNNKISHSSNKSVKREKQKSPNILSKSHNKAKKSRSLLNISRSSSNNDKAIQLPGADQLFSEPLLLTPSKDLKRCSLVSSVSETSPKKRKLDNPPAANPKPATSPACHMVTNPKSFPFLLKRQTSNAAPPSDATHATIVKNGSLAVLQVKEPAGRQYMLVPSNEYFDDQPEGTAVNPNPDLVTMFTNRLNEILKK